MRCLKRHRALARFAKSRRFQTAAQHSVKIFHPDPNGTKLRRVWDVFALRGGSVIREWPPSPRSARPLSEVSGFLGRNLQMPGNGCNQRIERALSSIIGLNLVPFHPDPYFSRSVFDKYDILSYCV